jgi:hypothetical protein
MTPNHSSDVRFRRELRATLATLQCLSEYAAEQGDAQSSSILHNAAALLDVAMAFKTDISAFCETSCQHPDLVPLSADAAHT